MRRGHDELTTIGGGTGGGGPAALRAEEAVDHARLLGRDPALADLDDDQLLGDLCRGASELAAATCRWLVLLGEVVVRGLWAVDGARTPTAWLSWRLGIGTSTAREHVRVALRLRELPSVRDRFAEGTLSYSKVRAISRVATPTTEAMLLRWADAATAAELDRIVADTRRVAAAATAPTARDDLGLTSRWRDDGTYEITIRLDTADGLAVEQRIRRLVDAADRDGAQGNGTDGRGTETTDATPDTASADPPARRAPLRMRAADAVCGALALAVDVAPADTSGLDRHLAVVELSTAALAAHRTAPTAPPGAPDPTAPAGAPAAPPPEAREARPRVHAHADDAGSDVVLVGAGRGGPRRPLPLRQLHRLLCDSALDVLLDALDRPVDLGRTRRGPDARLRRLVTARDRTCRMPGCDTTHWLHLHHVVPWEHGGRTDLDNLVLLCGFHHRLIHTDGWRLRPVGPGRWTFHPPAGTDPATGGRSHRPDPLPHAAPPPAALDRALHGVLADRAGDRDHRALLPPDHDGDGYDHDLTVSVLLDRLTATGTLPRERSAA